jgi:hypothetical protein
VTADEAYGRAGYFRAGLAMTALLAAQRRLSRHTLHEVA